LDDSLQPLLSVIIPTQGAPQLEKCIQAGQALKKHCNLELIIIADNEKQISSVQSRFRLEKFIVFTTSGSAGVSAARNRGLEIAQGQYFLLIDEDCYLQDLEFLNELVLHAQKDPEALHGGGYRLIGPQSYWARVYNWTNHQWLRMGTNSQGHQVHLLGGFMFGHSSIQSRVRFNPLMLWGGEEKEMMLRLISLGIHGAFHPDFAIAHDDHTGIKKLIKRAFYQGYAAGFRKLQSSQKMKMQIPLKMIPGLAIFYCCSRVGILLGTLVEYKNRKPVTVPNNSPAA
jgi:glycosyltransferase involved in cell wall biosynthesis